MTKRQWRWACVYPAIFFSLLAAGLAFFWPRIEPTLILVSGWGAVHVAFALMPTVFFALFFTAFAVFRADVGFAPTPEKKIVPNAPPGRLRDDIERIDNVLSSHRIEFCDICTRMKGSETRLEKNLAATWIFN